MTAALSLLCRVVRRRLARGEDLEAVLTEYSRLSEEERAMLKELPLEK